LYLSFILLFFFSHKYIPQSNKHVGKVSAPVNEQLRAAIEQIKVIRRRRNFAIIFSAWYTKQYSVSKSAVSIQKYAFFVLKVNSKLPKCSETGICSSTGTFTLYTFCSFSIKMHLIVSKCFQINIFIAQNELHFISDAFNWLIVYGSKK